MTFSASFRQSRIFWHSSLEYLNDGDPKTFLSTAHLYIPLRKYKIVIIKVIVLIEKKNRKTFFDFWEVDEVQKAAIFYLQSHEKVVVSPQPGTKLTGYHLMILIHLLMLWKIKLDHWFGSNNVLK